MKRLIFLFLFALPAAAQVQLGGPVYTPTASAGILGATYVTYSADANCTVTSATNCTVVSATTGSATNDAPYNGLLVVTASTTLTATRNLVLPSQAGKPRSAISIENVTSQSVVAIGATGTGVTIPAGQTYSVVFDGTNYVGTGGGTVAGATSSTLGGVTLASGQTSTSLSTIATTGSASDIAVGSLAAPRVAGAVLPGSTSIPMVCYGDSYCSYGLGGDASQTYEGLLLTLPALTGRTTLSNLTIESYPGQTCATVQSYYASVVHPLSPAVTGVPKILWFNCGANDFTAGTSLASLESTWLALMTSIRADGWIVMIGVPSSRVEIWHTATDYAVRAPFDDYIRSQALSTEYVTDWATLLPDPTDTGAYVDGIHPTLISRLRMAYQANAMLLGAQSNFQQSTISPAATGGDLANTTTAQIVGSTMSVQSAGTTRWYMPSNSGSFQWGYLLSGTYNAIMQADPYHLYMYKVPGINNGSQFNYINPNADTSTVSNLTLPYNLAQVGIAVPVITAGGTGYTSAPTVSFTSASCIGEAATANISGGAVTSLTITAVGGYCTSAPSVSFTGGGGTGAAATVQIQYVNTFAMTSDLVWSSPLAYSYGSTQTLSSTSGTNFVDSTCTSACTFTLPTLTNTQKVNGGIGQSWTIFANGSGAVTVSGTIGNIASPGTSFTLLPGMSATFTVNWNGTAYRMTPVGVFSTPVTVPQIIGSGSAPTMAAGSAAGTGSSCTTISGTNMAGTLSCTTGTPTTTGTLATITFSGTLSTAFAHCSIDAGNGATSIAGTSVYTTDPSATAWTIGVATALAASTTYHWGYSCF